MKIFVLKLIFLNGSRLENMRRHASCVAIESVRNVLIALVSYVRVLFIIVRFLNAPSQRFNHGN